MFKQIASFFVIVSFTTTLLFADDPSSTQAASPPQTTSEEAKSVPPSVQAMQSIPNVTTKTEMDKSTDKFLRGGFCVITAVMFIVGFLAVKTNSGSKTRAAS